MKLKMLEEQQLREFNKLNDNFTIKPIIHLKNIPCLSEKKGNTGQMLHQIKIKKEIEDANNSNEFTDEVFIEPEIKFEEENLPEGLKKEIKEAKKEELKLIEIEDESLNNIESTKLLEKFNKESQNFIKKSLLSMVRNKAWCDFNNENDMAALTCTKCQINFNSEADFFKHQKNQDCDVFKCTECNKIFDRSISLKIHMAFHRALKRYKCKICKKSFTRRSSLKDHTLSHSGEKPYQCDVCKKFYRSKRSLVSHFRYHFKDKIYECTVCKKSFFQPSGLSEHLRMHRKAKEYKCNICSKFFGYGSSLKRHIKSHSGGTVYQCNECDKCFKQNSSLSFHKRTKHLGLKPYKCEDCDKTFSRAWSLKNHMNIHRILQIPNTIEIISTKEKINEITVR